MTKLSLFNFWSKRVSKGVAHSAQAVLRPGALIANSKNVQSGSCGRRKVKKVIVHSAQSVMGRKLPSVKEGNNSCGGNSCGGEGGGNCSSSPGCNCGGDGD